MQVMISQCNYLNKLKAGEGGIIEIMTYYMRELKQLNCMYNINHSWKGHHIPFSIVTGVNGIKELFKYHN
jgi:hypothetical protein